MVCAFSLNVLPWTDHAGYAVRSPTTNGRIKGRRWDYATVTQFVILTAFLIVLRAIVIIIIVMLLDYGNYELCIALVSAIISC